MRGFPGGWGGGGSDKARLPICLGPPGPTCSCEGWEPGTGGGSHVIGQKPARSITPLRQAETAFVTSKGGRPTATAKKKQCTSGCQLSCQFDAAVHNTAIPRLRETSEFRVLGLGGSLSPTASRWDSPPHATNARRPLPASRIPLSFLVGSLSVGPTATHEVCPVCCVDPSYMRELLSGFGDTV